MSRRRNLGALAALAWAASGGVLAAPTRALREMQVHKIDELKLEIWVENQPAWSTQLSRQTGHPTFIAESPDDYHPPTVMTFASWPNAHSPEDGFYGLASSAIRRASQNVGLTLPQARGLQLIESDYDILHGYESTFDGKSDDTAMDVTVFVGQAPGKLPVALAIYTLRGKIGGLTEQRRRSWSKLKYL